MTAALDRAFDALQSDVELSASAMQPLSDMDTAAAEETRRRWASLSAARRRTAMRLAGSLAAEHIELNFDRLALIGLQDSDAEVRRQAVANLWESEDASLVARLLELLQEDTDASVRAEAAGALGRFVLAMEEQELGSPDRNRLENALLRAASSENEGLRLHAVESLGFSSRPEVPDVIQSAYDLAHEAARRSALVAMGRSGDRRWRQIVLAELRSPAPSVRREAARAAGEIDLRASLPDLIDLLEDADPEVELQAIWALGQIGGKTAERALLRAQRSSGDPQVQLAIQEAQEHLTFLEGTRDLEAALRARREAK